MNIDELIKMYDSDPGSPYEWTVDQIRDVMCELGELEPLIDALLMKEGASIKERANAIGVNPEDYDR